MSGIITGCANAFQKCYTDLIAKILIPSSQINYGKGATMKRDNVLRYLLCTSLLFSACGANLPGVQIASQTQIGQLEQPAPPEPPAIRGVRSTSILVDDFKPQPYQGDELYYYNRLDGDRGGISDTLIKFGQGSVNIAIAPGSTWGGMWWSLNHPIREGKAINFSAVLPEQVKPEYQTIITGMEIQVQSATPNGILKVELKNNDTLQWAEQLHLNGEAQLLQFSLPALTEVNHLVLVLDQAQGGDYAVIERIALTAETPVTDTATAAFVWSYGMLLENWNLHTGLVRDKARDASGEFDALQATGNLASVSALASQLGVITHADAISIVDKISATLLYKIPHQHGLLPHWVRTPPDGQFVIVEGTE
jgi:hypothetical protein